MYNTCVIVCMWMQNKCHADATVSLGQLCYRQCCGSGSCLSLWCGFGYYLSLWCGCGSGSYLSLWCGPGSGTKLSSKGSQPWKGAEKGSYSLHFGLPSANWWGSGSSLPLWWGSWSYLSIWCGSMLIRIWIRIHSNGCRIADTSVWGNYVTSLELQIRSSLVSMARYSMRIYVRMHNAPFNNVYIYDTRSINYWI
jgi:hypothetical protein